MGGVILIPLAVLICIKEKRKNSCGLSTIKSKFTNSLTGGAICGLLLFAASTLQQYGIVYTSVGKAGFLTALYIVIVPVLGTFIKRKTSVQVWFSCIVAVCGFYFLCLSEQFALSKGDFLVFLCAIMFSFHILAIDYFSPKGNPVIISCMQFFSCSLISGLLMLIFETPSVERLKEAAIPVLYAGILSSGVAYTLQIAAQKNISPTVATLIMSLESVFSALAGWLFLHQSLTKRELFGCFLIFTAVTIAQLPQNFKFKNFSKISEPLPK